MCGCHADTGLTVTCSIFTLAALSIDHYFTVKAPTRRSQQLDSGQRGAIITLVVIWVVSALLVGPILLVRHVHHVDLGIDQVSFISANISLSSTVYHLAILQNSALATLQPR